MTDFVGLADLLKRENPLLLPVAHDALSARMIERAGFAAAAIGGFGVIGCRTGLPDLGLASFGEISAAVRDIAGATRLPLIVDADDGYGDVKNVVRTVRVYEDMGVSAIVLEDQVSPKKCGHAAVTREVVPVATAEAKLAAAIEARRNPDFAIVARTDARLVEGLDAAIERGRRYIDKGADALFVEAPTSIGELETIGAAFDVPLIVNAAERGKTPVLSPETYRDMGFSIILYPATLLLRMIGTFERTLAALRTGKFAEEGELPTFATLTNIMGMDEWMEIDRRHG
ncbi:isocitrate lyase/phosphoenolpyruvate mutase family protein [Sphingomonas naphthae]|uniref:Isocitrate lyase/phosphoenolpyruvate mutase family protein n=1 Tax=Sphingomonas naphthae TaxID=1813468 RepID=A0ABY7TML3_9SPHN|nr:isocitrate lyase/phosphoenolpyruvate mutase family protein [Sphingomonas naphthae]WCT74465.1 isocitrate lyase/phosphoenolpyruvate mutase family protein [Sphingomonas naphthae]